MRRKLYLLIFLLPVFLGNPTFGQHLKIISYNIHHGADKNEQQTLKEMGDFIKSIQADLVGLQEVDSLCKRSGYVDQMKQLAAITGMYYAFVRHFAYDGGAYGLGILSRYPLSDIRNDRITSKAVEGKKRSLALLSAKVTLPNKHEVRFGTVHFALDQPTRMVQSAETIDLLKTDMPVILTGDMNAEPENEAIKQLETYFSITQSSDAFTFPVDKPVKKIDYIMVSDRHLAKIIDTEVYEKAAYSDHLPLSSTIELRAP